MFIDSIFSAGDRQCKLDCGIMIISILVVARHICCKEFGDTRTVVDLHRRLSSNLGFISRCLLGCSSAFLAASSAVLCITGTCFVDVGSTLCKACSICSVTSCSSWMRLTTASWKTWTSYIRPIPNFLLMKLRSAAYDPLSTSSSQSNRLSKY